MSAPAEPRRRSLTTALTWWFALALLTLYGLAASLVWVHTSIRARQYAELTLKTEAETLAVFVGSTGRMDAPELQAAENEPIPMWLRVVRNGRVVASTPGTPKVTVSPALPRGGEVVSAYQPAATSLLVVRHAVGNALSDTVVEAIGSLVPLARQQRRLGGGLLLLGVVVIPLAAGGGSLLARRALRPVRALVDDIQTIDPDHPGHRLAFPPTGASEIALLASAFNGLLARLEGSLEGMRRFTADASHEIRNPLSVMRTGLEVALRRERTPAEYQTVLRENLQEITRLQAVLDGLLALARDVRGTEESIQRGHVDLSGLVADTVATFVTAAQERNVTIHARVEPGLVVDGDERLLRLVIFNLVDNALKHSPDGERVHLEATAADGQARLLVSDHGPGVDAGDRQRVFERFFRGASESGIGGLGLSVVRWASELHGGAVRLLDSAGGATFEVCLPLDQPASRTSRTVT